MIDPKEGIERRDVRIMNPITMLLQADPLIRMALQEDISDEDVTTNAVLPLGQRGSVELIAKQEGILAGLPVYKRVFELLDPDTQIETYAKDGDRITAGERLAKLTGDMRVLLSGERVALNFLQRMKILIIN